MAGKTLGCLNQGACCVGGAAIDRQSQDRRHGQYANAMITEDQPDVGDKRRLRL